MVETGLNFIVYGTCFFNGSNFNIFLIEFIEQYMVFSPNYAIHQCGLKMVLVRV